MGDMVNGNKQTGAHVLPFAKGQSQMRHAMIQEVRAYWEALREGQQVPRRAQIDPRGIERALENAFVLERIAPGIARFRLAGMHVNDLMGMEVRGMPLTALFTAPARQNLSRLLEGVFAGPEVCELVLTGETGAGRPPMTAQMILLPLRCDQGEVSRALGCLVLTDGAAGRAPRRLVVSDARVTALPFSGPVLSEAPLQVKQDILSSTPPAANSSGFAEGAAPFTPARPERARPRLRLVKTDD